MDTSSHSFEERAKSPQTERAKSFDHLRTAAFEKRGTTDDSTEFRPLKRQKTEYNLAKEFTHTMTNITHEDVSEARDRIEVIINKHEPEKRTDRINNTNEASASIQERLKDMSPKERIDYLRRHLDEEDVTTKKNGPLIRMICLEIVNKKIYDKILDKVNRFIKSAGIEFESKREEKYRIEKISFEQALDYIRNGLESKSYERSKKFINEYLNYNGSESSKIAVCAIFQSLLDDMKIGSTNNEDRIPAHQDLPPIPSPSRLGDSSQQLRDRAQSALSPLKRTYEQAYQKANKRYETDADAFQNAGSIKGSPLDQQTERSFQLMDNLDTMQRFISNTGRYNESNVKEAMYRLSIHIGGEAGHIADAINGLNHPDAKAFYEKDKIPFRQDLPTISDPSRLGDLPQQLGNISQSVHSPLKRTKDKIPFRQDITPIQGPSHLVDLSRQLRDVARSTLSPLKSTYGQAYQAANKRYETDANAFQNAGSIEGSSLDQQTERSFQLMDDLKTVRRFISNTEEESESNVKKAMYRLSTHTEGEVGHSRRASRHITEAINGLNHPDVKAFYEST